MALILLVDDHPLFHEGLASAFGRLAPEFSRGRAQGLA
jgi:hypothetical protein